MTLSCPRCRKPLVPETVERVPVDRCLRCDGIWLDDGELETILATGPPPAAISGGIDAPPKAEAMEWELPCPKCEQIMHRFQYGATSGIVLDKCEGHGLWFDFEELDRMRRHIEEQRRTVEPRKPDGVWQSLTWFLTGRRE